MNANDPIRSDQLQHDPPLHPELPATTTGRSHSTPHLLDGLSGHTAVPPAQRGTQNQALGRSRGGFSSKLHLRVNADGLPIEAVLTAGEAHDVTAYDDLMEQRDSDPGALLADKGMIVMRSGRI